MKAAVITWLVLLLLGAGWRLYDLANATYPRKAERSRGQDAFSVFVDIGIAFWLVWELTR